MFRQKCVKNIIYSILILSLIIVMTPSTLGFASELSPQEKDMAVITYTEPNFNGTKNYLSPGKFFHLGEYNNSIRSLKVRKGFTVTLYEDEFLKGKSIIITEDTPFIGDEFSISSILVEEPPSSGSSFSIDAQGTGSFVGLAYTIPPYTEGEVKAKINTLAMTSEDVQNLNNIVMSMLNASQKEKIEEYKKIHASANLSIWSFFGGGGSASYDQTYNEMRSFGLTEDQITKIINELFEAAKKMSKVEIDFFVDNRKNDFAVSGDLELYTIAGTIKTKKGTVQYRFLADQGTAAQGKVPVTDKIIPLK